MTNITDLLANSARSHSVDLAKFTAGEQARMIRLLRRVHIELEHEFISFDFGKRTVTQQKRLKEFLSVVKTTLRIGYKGLDAAHTPVLIDLADVETQYAINSLNRIYPNLVDTTFTTTQLAALVEAVPVTGLTVNQWFGQLAGNDLVAYTKVIQNGVLLGQPNAQVVRNMKDISGVSSRHMKSFVRTSINTISNASKNAVYQDNADVLEGVQQISTLDSRTSPICMAYASKVWTLPDYKPIGHNLKWNGGPSRHVNCRSTTIPITKAFRKLTQNGKIKDTDGKPTYKDGKKIKGKKELPKRTRAAITEETRTKGGRLTSRTVKNVRGDITFDEFLREASPTTRKKLLGPGKLKLWEQGKITTSDLVNFEGQPLSLAQLKKLVGDE